MSSKKQIVCCLRDFPCKRNDQASCLIILGNFEGLNQDIMNGKSLTLFELHRLTLVPETATGLLG